MSAEKKEMIKSRTAEWFHIVEQYVKDGSIEALIYAEGGIGVLRFMGLLSREVAEDMTKVLRGTYEEVVEKKAQKNREIMKEKMGRFKIG